MPRKDLTGRRFGRLTVLWRTGQKRNGKSLWHCHCDCGQECDVQIDNIQSGNVRSCGCIRREMYQKRTLPPGQRAANDRYAAYRTSARKRHITFELSKDEFMELSQQPCYYCGQEPSNIAKSPDNTGDFVCNGIDRVDPAVGYVYSNCVSCCGRCNEAKMDLSISDFKAWIAKVYLYFVENKSSICLFEEEQELSDAGKVEEWHMR